MSSDELNYSAAVISFGCIQLFYIIWNQNSYGSRIVTILNYYIVTSNYTSFLYIKTNTIKAKYNIFYDKFLKTFKLVTHFIIYNS